MECKVVATKETIEKMEARTGVEPVHKGFADLVTTPESTFVCNAESSHVPANVPVEWSSERLIQIFRPTQNSTMYQQLSCDAISIHIMERGWIAVEIVDLTPFVGAADEAPTMLHSGNESDNHRALKLLATRWLRSRGSRMVEYEVHYGVGRGDVVALDLDIFVECGNSEPAKIDSLLSGKFGGMLVVPYADPQAPILGYLFTTTDAGKEFGVSEKKRLDAKMRTLLNELYPARDRSAR